MVDIYTYRVAWSATHQKYAARCLEFPALEALGITQRDALDQIVQFVDEFAEGERTDGTQLASDQVRQTGRIHSDPVQPARVVPRWRTRC